MKYSAIVLSFLLMACGTEYHPTKKGKDGVNGKDGVSVVFKTLPTSQCVNGGSTLLMAYDSNWNGTLDSNDAGLMSTEVCNGSNGSNGKDGSNGSDGKDGVDGAKGDKGDQGNQGETPKFSPVELIDPCGDAPGIYDEILLKLANGSILASFSDDAAGKNTRFSLLTDGVYMTTDGSSCTFKVSGEDVGW